MEKLSLETLPLYDGGSLAVRVNEALRSVYLDLDDRPLVGKTREVHVIMKFKPEDVETTSGTPALESVAAEMSVKLVLPNKESRVNVIAPSPAHGGMIFDPDRRRVARGAEGEQHLPYDEAEA